MGTAHLQGDLWGRSPEGWAMIQEPQHRYLWEAMMDAAMAMQAADVAPTMRMIAACDAARAQFDELMSRWNTLKMTERGANVRGLDAAEGLLAFARERAPGADFRVGDIEDLPYEDDAFDVVFAANSVQYSADRVAALQGFASELGAVLPVDRPAVDAWGPRRTVRGCRPGRDRGRRGGHSAPVRGLRGVLARERLGRAVPGSDSGSGRRGSESVGSQRS